jgi:hypothetical protein
MYAEFIKRKIGYLVSERTNKVSYIKYMKGHKNSKGESAPWCILSHGSGKVLSSHKNKSEAKSHLRDIEIHKKTSKFGFFSEDKRKEIIVYIWMNGNKYKDDVKQIIMDKFNVSESDAEKFFYEAFPDGTSPQEEESYKQLDSSLQRTIAMNPSFISEFIDMISGDRPEIDLSAYNMPSDIVSQLKVVVSSALKERNLI